MIQTILRAILILFVVNLAAAQYGIPDDDDHPVPSRRVASPIMSVLSQARAAAVPVTPEPSMTYYEEPLSYPNRIEEYAALAPVEITPSRVEIRHERAHYEAPVIAVRTVEKPILAYEAPVIATRTIERPVLTTYAAPEKVVIRESLPAYTPSVIVKDNSYATPTVTLKKEIPIVKYVMEDDNYGTYRLETVSADGTVKSESGHLKNLGDVEGPVQVMSGTYSYVGDDGKTYTVVWKADEEGFLASGDHLPKAPAPLH